jgi:hypothetical protein
VKPSMRHRYDLVQGVFCHTLAAHIKSSMFSTFNAMKLTNINSYID